MALLNSVQLSASAGVPVSTASGPVVIAHRSIVPDLSPEFGAAGPDVLEDPLVGFDSSDLTLLSSREVEELLSKPSLVDVEQGYLKINRIQELYALVHPVLHETVLSEEWREEELRCSNMFEVLRSAYRSITVEGEDRKYINQSFVAYVLKCRAKDKRCSVHKLQEIIVRPEEKFTLHKLGVLVPSFNKFRLQANGANQLEFFGLEKDAPLTVGLLLQYLPLLLALKAPAGNNAHAMHIAYLTLLFSVPILNL